MYVNDQIVNDEALRVLHGDNIELKTQGTGSRKAATQRTQLSGIKIIHIDEHIVIVEKPAGMVTQAIANSEEEFDVLEASNTPTLEELIIPLVKKIVAAHPELKSGAPRQVHRIDKDTSGILVFARTGKAYDSLKLQFFEHTIDREYLAVVAGRIQRNETIRSYLIRDRGDGKRGSSARPQAHSKLAITHFEPIESFSRITIIRCHLETGRTHQIRIHLADSGHPLLGDPIYGSEYAYSGILPPPRLALHARSLGFLHPNGKRVYFESDLPEDLSKWLDRLRKSHSR